MQRDRAIDIAKGLGILLVVAGHLSSPVTGNACLQAMRSFIYQFHIPLFFFISGLFIKSGEPWGPFLKKKALRLYLPYILANAVFLAINVAAHMINGDKVVALDTAKHMCKVTLGLAVTPLGGATWFLSTLFFAHILHKALMSLSRLLHREWPATSLMAALGIVGMAVCPSSPASRVLVAMFFMEAGRICMKRNVLQKAGNVPVGIISLAVVILCACFNEVDMSQGTYGILPLFILSSSAGIALTYAVSVLLSRTGAAAAALDYTGRKTMWVLIGHFAAFKVVTAIQMLAWHAPFDSIFSHPCFVLNGAWPLAYLIVGLSLPLAISTCRKSHS